MHQPISESAYTCIHMYVYDMSVHIYFCLSTHYCIYLSCCASPCIHSLYILSSPRSAVLHVVLGDEEGGHREHPQKPPRDQSGPKGRRPDMPVPARRLWSSGMDMYIYIYMCIYVYMYMYLCIYIYICVCISTCQFRSIYTWMNVLFVPVSAHSFRV